MNLVNRFREVYGWTPNYHLDSKKPDQKVSNWILFSYDPDPVCLWISGSTVKKLYTGLDERLCGDTIFQAEYKDGTYIIHDLFMLNSCRVFDKSTKEQRRKWLETVEFYHVRGLDEIRISKGTRVSRSEIPDVYLIPEGYIQVPDIETSEYLRSLGDSFDIQLEERDGLWFVKNLCLT
jgi:hypothetical protein